ncbi:hypothetical protein ACLOJK_013768, partial [Asimina triloba]
MRAWVTTGGKLLKGKRRRVRWVSFGRWCAFWKSTRNFKSLTSSGAFEDRPVQSVYCIGYSNYQSHATFVGTFFYGVADLPLTFLHIKSQPPRTDKPQTTFFNFGLATPSRSVFHCPPAGTSSCHRFLGFGSAFRAVLDPDLMLMQIWQLESTPNNRAKLGVARLFHAEKAPIHAHIPQPAGCECYVVLKYGRSPTPNHQSTINATVLHSLRERGPSTVVHVHNRWKILT